MHLQCTGFSFWSIVLLNGIGSKQIYLSVFACHVVDEQRRFSTTGASRVHCSCVFPTIAILQWGYPSPLSPHYLFLLYYSHSSSLSLSTLFQSFPVSVCWVSRASGCICLCVCHLSFSLSLFPSLPLADSRLVWRHQTACIFSAATDGAMAACQRPECSLSQLSGRSPGPKWSPSTWEGRWGRKGRSFFCLLPLQIEVLIVSFWHG